MEIEVKLDPETKKWRLYEKNTDRLATRSDTGAVLDGGGHDDAQKASRQSFYINQALRKKADAKAKTV